MPIFAFKSIFEYSYFESLINLSQRQQPRRQPPRQPLQRQPPRQQLLRQQQQQQLPLQQPLQQQLPVSYQIRLHLLK